MDVVNYFLDLPNSPRDETGCEQIGKMNDSVHQIR